MSMRALLRGVVARLIDGLDLPPAPSAADGIPHPMCGMQPDGRPPTDMGQMYLAVHPTAVQNLDPNSLSNDRGYSVSVTILKKFRDVPKDRRGVALCEDDGLWDFGERVADLIHQDDAHGVGENTTLTEANKLIPGTREYLEAHGSDPDGATVNGFIEPLRLQTIQAPASESPAFAGEDGSGDDADPDDLLKLVVVFGGARRVRVIGS